MFCVHGAPTARLVRAAQDYIASRGFKDRQLRAWGSVNKPRQQNIAMAARPSFDALDGRAAVGATGQPPSHVDDPLGAPSLARAKLHAEQLLPHLPHRRAAARPDPCPNH